VTSEWIVLLEFAVDPRHAVDKATLFRVVEAVGKPSPVALHSSDRYAVQLEVLAEDPPEALSSALSAWSRAVRTIVTPAWRLARAEVLTRPEFEHELMLAEGDHDPHGTMSGGDSEVRTGTGGLAEDLLHQALHDSLTGLPTEGLFRDRLDRALARARSAHQHHAVLVVGFDGLAQVRQNLGPAIGDTALVTLARRLVAVIGPGDIAGRLADDRLAAFLADRSEDEVMALVREVVNVMAVPLTVHGHEMSAKATVGIAPSESGERLLGSAVAALEGASTGRTGGWAVVRPGDQPRGPEPFRP
jgi:diguanylate cyclase (GGDEF)-like protein